MPFQKKRLKRHPRQPTLFGGFPTGLRERHRFLLATTAGRDAVEHVRQEGTENALNADHLVPCAAEVLFRFGDV